MSTIIFYYWVTYNSLVSQWPIYERFCIPVKADLFFHRKKSSSRCITIFSDKRHYHEIIDCAGELQMLRHHQGHLTLTNISYPMIIVLCSEILLLQNGLIVTQRGCSEFEKAIFWERNATQKQNPSWQWSQFSGTLWMIKMLMVRS